MCASTTGQAKPSPESVSTPIKTHYNPKAASISLSGQPWSRVPPGNLPQPPAISLAGRQNRCHQAQLHRLFRVQSWAYTPRQSGSGSRASGAYPALWEAPWVVVMPSQCGGPRVHPWVPSSFCCNSKQGGGSCPS